MLSVECVRSDATAITQVDDGVGGYIIGVDDFVDDGSLLDDINFDDLFVGIEDGDLPDLDMDLADFSSVEESTSYSPDHLLNSSPAASASGESCLEEEKKEKVEATATVSASSRRKSTSSASAKLAHGNSKRKVKVDWTPELHRRFVQAVEQLGVDKAVPSRILELMGIDCLTRHNIASHLQKYRSHRKHLLAREAEAANWTQRRQIYSSGRTNAGGVANGGGVVKREMAPWVVPTIGFPPPGAVPAPFRPFHVWGHPHPHPVDQPPPMVQVWPKHLVRSPAPPPPWSMPPAGAAPPNRPPYWFPHHPLLGGSHMTQGTPYYPQPLTPAHRFHAPVPVPVPGIPQAMFKADANAHTLLPPGHLHIDFHIPSKESIDAALEDVLEQPWLPLPLGLKPPSTDSVLVELHRQGISKIPPSCA